MVYINNTVKIFLDIISLRFPSKRSENEKKGKCIDKADWP